MISNKERMLARIIFSEAGPNCSYIERISVGRTFRNRAMHKGFKPNTIYGVATEPGAYSCIGDTKNQNWAKSATYPMSKAESVIADKTTLYAWNDALEIASEFAYYLDVPMSKQSPEEYPRVPVYYHDRSIAKPKSWDNKWWTAIRHGETDRFIFYSAIPTTNKT